MEIRPDRRLGLVIGVGLLVVDLALAVGLAYRAVASEPSLASFSLALAALVLLGAGAVLAYWTYGLLSLRYHVGDGYLTIRWADLTERVPLARIERVLPGTELGRRLRITGLSWPGHHVGIGRLPGVGPVRFYSTHRALDRLVCVVTASGDAYALSVADPGTFETRVRAGALAGDLPPEVRRARLLQLRIFDDRIAFSVVALAFAANLLLFAFAAWTFPRLPELLPLHFTAGGDVDRIGFRLEIFRIPVIALLVLALNTLLALAIHTYERLAALLCLLAALLAQVLFWVALAKIVA